MKKVAIVFHGISSGKNDKGLPVNFDDAYMSFVENVINSNKDKFEFETYFHTWNSDRISDVVDLYKPKKFIAEDRINFTDIYQSDHLDHLSTHINKSYNTYKFITPEVVVSMLHSRFYSLWRSIALLDEDYDIVISLRFDLIFLNPFILDDISPNTMQCSYFIENQNHLNVKKFHLDGYFIDYDPEIYEYGVMDYIFIGRHETMVRFAKLHMHIAHYLSIGSDYYNNRWPCILSGHALSAYHMKQLKINVSYYMTLGKDFCLERDKYDVPLNTLMECGDEIEKMLPKVTEIANKYNVEEMTFTLLSQIGTSFWKCNILDKAEIYWNLAYKKQTNNVDCINLILFYQKVRNKEKFSQFIKEGLKHEYINKQQVKSLLYSSNF